MAWFDRERIASFKGFEIQVSDVTETGGKKGKESDYVEQDGGSSEDLGNKARSFTVQGIT